MHITHSRVMFACVSTGGLRLRETSGSTDLSSCGEVRAVVASACMASMPAEALMRCTSWAPHLAPGADCSSSNADRINSGFCSQ